MPRQTQPPKPDWAAQRDAALAAIYGRIVSVGEMKEQDQAGTLWALPAAAQKDAADAIFTLVLAARLLEALREQAAHPIQRARVTVIGATPDADMEGVGG